jgi:hypothetical protein
MYPDKIAHWSLRRHGQPVIAELSLTLFSRRPGFSAGANCD